MKIDSWPICHTLDSVRQALPKMDPDLKAAWLAALRDPNAKQTTGVLRRADGSMCCLGVLCNVKDPSKWETTYKSDPPGMPIAYRGATKMPFPVEFPDMSRGIMSFLAEHNDSMEPDDVTHIYTFHDIANWIEENL